MRVQGVPDGGGIGGAKLKEGDSVAVCSGSGPEWTGTRGSGGVISAPWGIPTIWGGSVASDLLLVASSWEGSSSKPGTEGERTSSAAGTETGRIVEHLSL